MPTPDINVVSGTPNAGNINTELLVRAVDPVLHFYQFNQHPLASLILSMGTSLVERPDSPAPSIKGKSIRKKGYGNMKVEYNEDDVFAKRSFSPTVAVAASDTSITVSSTDDDHFKANDIILLSNAAGLTERLKISSVAANILNVVNPDGTTRTAGITMTTSDEFYLGENVRQDDSTAPAIRTTSAATLYNYMEFVSETYGVSIVNQLTKHYDTKDPMALEKAKAYSRLLQKLEFMAILGTRALATSSTNPEWHSGGLKYFMELYSDVEIRNMGGAALTKAEFDSFLTATTKAGSPNKVALCDSRTLEVINGFGYENVQVPNYRVGEIGMNVKKVFGPHGELTLVHEPLFDTHRWLNGSIMVLDLMDIEFAYLQGGQSINVPGVGTVSDGDIKDYPILQADGTFSSKRQLAGLCGFKFNTLRHFGWMKRVGV